MVDRQTSPQQPAPSDETPYQRGFTWPRAVANVAVVTMILYWTWIFSGAPAKDNPDRLEDRAYAAQLEDQCQGLRDDLEKLPNAADLSTPAARADVLDRANVLVGKFIDELEGGAPTSGDASVSIRGWIGDWRKYLANREDYAERLRTEPNAQLLLDRSELGDSVDKTIQIFSQVNEIPSCDTPGDVG